MAGVIFLILQNKNIIDLQTLSTHINFLLSFMFVCCPIFLSKIKPKSYHLMNDKRKEYVHTRDPPALQKVFIQTLISSLQTPY